jgi:PKD repeat protein
VTHTDTNDGNLSAGTTLPITVTTGEPTASFAYSPDAAAPHTLNFDASGSKAAPGAKIASYKWDFGDGTQQITAIPVVAHAYAAAGSRIVTLTVTDDAGRTSTPNALLVTIP